MNQIRAPETKSHTHALQAFKKTFFMRYFLFFSSCFFFLEGEKFMSRKQWRHNIQEAFIIVIMI